MFLIRHDVLPFFLVTSTKCEDALGRGDKAHFSCLSREHSEEAVWVFKRDCPEHDSPKLAEGGGRCKSTGYENSWLFTLVTVFGK
jgi:hypothetical protein